jgi:hypothetical protein
MSAENEQGGTSFQAAPRLNGIECATVWHCKTMPDAEFPSGPWTGYYQYPDGKRGSQDLRLHFSQGRMSGSGADEVGQFVVEGSYDAASKEAHWLKRYPSGHRVEYRGFREGPVTGIWGTWQIPLNWSGGFHIWPLDGDAREDVEQAASHPLTVGAPARLIPTDA